MLTEIQDRDTIFSGAMDIASATERDAYIAQTCGNDAVLRRQVEEMVAVHFQASSPDKPAPATANGALPSGRNLEQVGANHAEESVEAGKRMRKHPRSLVTMGALLLLASGVSISLTAWALRAEGQARTAAQQAVDECALARQAEAEVKRQRDEALAARQTTAEERDEALAAEKTARRSEQDAKTVLAFLQNKVLSAGHSMGWGGGPIKDVTLRKAVDAAVPKAAEAFADQPLVEASVRQILGSTYLALGEAALAVKQYERALALREAMLGDDHPEFGDAHPDTGDCRNKLAVAYRLAGRGDDASRLYDQNFRSPFHTASLAVRGAMLLTRKKPVQAELKLRECLAIRQMIQPPDWITFDVKSMLGEALLDQKKYADAESLLLSGYEGMKQREAQIPSQAKVRLTKALERLVRLYEGWGKEDKAAEWRKELGRAELTKKS